MKRDPVCMKNDMLKTLYSKQDLEATTPRVDEAPFDSSRKMMSYSPDMQSGVYAVTFWTKSIVPVTFAPLVFKASTWALLRFISSTGTPALLMNAPRIVPNDPAPYIAVRIVFISFQVINTL